MAMRVETNPMEAAYAALLSQGLDGAGEALRILVNEASKIERARHLNAQPFERCEERHGYAHGVKPKTVMTRMGELTFAVPQVRDSSFYPSALDKGSRTEQALNLGLAEMYVQGVSTRKVITVLQSLLGPEVSISSTQVSRVAETLDAGLQAWRERPLGERPTSFSMPVMSGCVPPDRSSIARCWWRSASRLMASAGGRGSRWSYPRPRCIGAAFSKVWRCAVCAASS